MKKYITSTIGSAIIVPGFGQVLNGQIKKGLILMGVVFVIFIAGVIKLMQVITGILPDINPDKIDIKDIQARIDITDDLVLKIIIIFFVIVWIYAIIDAFIVGITLEKKRKQFK